mgnify:CR=1 FL=1
MNKQELKHFKNKLNEEKSRITDLIKQLDDNGMTKFNAETASELSFYDNHPADIASETFEVEKGRALEANEIIKVKVLENSLLDVRETCDEICERTEAYPVQCIGNKFVIYRESKNNKTIIIPR